MLKHAYDKSESENISAYLLTWKLKLSHTKTMMAAFHLNNQEPKHELKVYNNNRFFIILSYPHLSLGKTGQVAHVPSPSSDIEQKTILAHHTAEATCRLRMECWCQNTAHSCPGLLNS